MGMVSIAFDGITAYTVNHLDTIPVIVNNISILPLPIGKVPVEKRRNENKR